MIPLIIIPALNEAATIATVIQRTREYGWNDILVIDDFSEDATGQIAINNGAHLIRLPINLGAWGAIQTGIRYALEKGYPAVLTMDGDNQHKPGHIRELLIQLELGSDVVIGSCLSRGALLKQLIWPFLRKISGLDVQDLTSGFRAYNRKAMELLLSNESFILDYQDIGVLLLCKKNNLMITEIEVKMDERAHGKSRIFKNAYMVMKYFLSTVFLIITKRW